MKNRTVTDKNELTDIIRKSKWCHLAMTDAQGKPYLVPLNFGFKDDIIYMHGAKQGKKIDALKQNPGVCVNFSVDQLLYYRDEKVACSWSMKYRSVLCYGNVEFIDDPEGKIEALNIIMSQYSGDRFKFNPPSIREVNVWKIRVEKFEGRVYGY